MKSDIEIARDASKKPVTEIGEKAGIPRDHLLNYGHYKAKVDYDFIEQQKGKKNGKLILVSSINPTPAGEGKTTTTVGLGDALNHLGKNAAICLREPALGPSFGVKGGAAGGGMSQVVPMEDINLHFTGDFHAIGIAHNLMCALVDNHIFHGNEPEIDSRRVALRRVVDMNDRALRQITNGLGGVSNGFAREDGFDIVVASEVMAVLCLATSLEDLKERLGRIIVGYTRNREPVRARDINAHGAMSALLRDALMPNLVQTLENNPAYIHGGPFANIAHGCNSVMATQTALKLHDYVVTEAGFGSDLGAEKFMDIKCRQTGLAPDAVVLVATVRALKMHGGMAKDNLKTENVEAMKEGCANLERHLNNLKKYGVPAVVAINRFPQDTEAELNTLHEIVKGWGAEVKICTHFGDGGQGAKELGEHVISLADSGQANFQPLYPNNLSLTEKIRKICYDIYGAGEVDIPSKVANQIKRLEDQGYGDVPVCMAKTANSFTADGTVVGAPTGFSVPIREVVISAGAGFAVVKCGDIMTMPALPKEPAANKIDLDNNGDIVGLF